MFRFKKLFTALIYSPAFVYFLRRRNLLEEEIDAWYTVLPLTKPKGLMRGFVLLFSLLSEFRSVLYWRMGTGKWNPLRLIYPGQSALFFPERFRVGKRLIIQHGFSTIINPESIGDDCQIWQNVTIGKSRSGISQPRPVIGNNVRICAHAIVLGGITIGDNVTIGAGAVVTKSIPEGCTVVGNPARISNK